MTIVHGGDRVELARRFGVDPATLTDFSANVVHGGPPANVQRVLAAMANEPRALSPYPSPTYAALRERLAALHDLDPACVVVANGSAAALDATIGAFDARAWIVPVPAFSEYARAIAARKRSFIPFQLDATFDVDAPRFVEAVVSNDDAGAIINTPHNPSGVAIERPALHELRDACARLGRPLVLDEAFVDFEPSRSLVHDAVERQNLVVLRSLTKFYAIAGVRIGYAIAHPATAARIRSQLPSWPVGTIEEHIAVAAVDDDAYARLTRETMRAERARMIRALDALGLKSPLSVANFVLIEFRFSAALLDGVLSTFARRFGIVVRDCRSYDGCENRALIRCAILDPASNQRLLEALGWAVRSSMANVRPGIG